MIVTEDVDGKLIEAKKPSQVTAPCRECGAFPAVIPKGRLWQICHIVSSADESQNCSLVRERTGWSSDQELLIEHWNELQAIPDNVLVDKLKSRS